MCIRDRAIECRVNTEETQNRFAPQTGFIDMINFPSGDNIRIETGVQDGSCLLYTSRCV